MQWSALPAPTKSLMSTNGYSALPVSKLQTIPALIILKVWTLVNEKPVQSWIQHEAKKKSYGPRFLGVPKLTVCDE